MHSGARWLAEERQGRHDLGERNNSTGPDPLPAEKGGDPAEAAPHRYPLLWRLDWNSFAALEDAEAGVVKCTSNDAAEHFRQWLYGHGYLDAERAAGTGGVE